MKHTILTVFAALLLIACGGDQAAQSTASERTQPTADATAQTQAPRANEAAQPAEPAERVQLAQADAADALSESRFRSGTHYQTLSPVQPTSSGADQVEVAEFFMYSCIHCYNFDPYLEEWKQTIPDYVSFVRVPTVWNPVVRLHAQAYYTAEALGKLDEMHADFFREMHVNGNFLQSEQELADFFGRFDVSEEEFESTFNSFAVHAKVQRADELSRRYQITSTPSIVINGKYTTNASMAGGYDTLMELIDTLAAAERNAD